MILLQNHNMLILSRLQSVLGVWSSVWNLPLRVRRLLSESRGSRRLLLWLPGPGWALEPGTLLWWKVSCSPLDHVEGYHFQIPLLAWGSHLYMAYGLRRQLYYGRRRPVKHFGIGVAINLSFNFVPELIWAIYEFLSIFGPLGRPAQNSG